MSDFSDDNGQGDLPTSLLPYDKWLEDSYREVMIRALEFAQANGLPGEHHFYIAFQTGDSRVDIPAALRAQYPKEMTIVLQHQFWDLNVDREARRLTVGLSFGCVASKLSIPFGAIAGFTDPSVGVALGFQPVASPSLAADDLSTEATPEDTTAEAVSAASDGDAQIVRLDAFRKRPTS
ncbi:MAG: ClpXP protease specificity-enhancing factor SspB [Acetobacteraceae bacterium]